MKKLKGTSLDIIETNIEKLKELFPNVITESQIDFDKLRLILGDDVDEGVEKYQFTWPGKADAIRLAQSPSTKTLRPSIEDSKNWDTTENLYIEGDNLEVLKQLQKTYHSKVDVIYIDPPYNTGNDFVYSDKFAQSTDEYKEKSNQGLISNPESEGRYHSNWLNMMYPRLVLSRNLLKDTGIIVVSIDENEFENLKKIMDEIFGVNNYITNFIIDKTAQGANQSKTFKLQHEYLLMYKKNKEDALNTDIPIKRDEKKFKFKDSKGYYAITNSFDSINSPLSSNLNRGYTIYYKDMDNVKIRNEFDRNSQVFDEPNHELIKQGYTPIRPGIRNGIQYPWNWSVERFRQDYKQELVFRDLGSEVKIYHKNRFSGKNKDTTLKKFDTRKFGNQLLNKLLGNKVFDYPKSLEMLEWILTKHKNKNAIVLDYFAGSSTTAHAVLAQNVKDNGNRHFIMVQLPEETDEKSEARKAGYENICEIGKERIRRAGDKIVQELEDNYNLLEETRDPATLDIGFKVFKLDETNINAWDGSKVESDGIDSLLDLLEDVFKEDRTHFDVVYEIMLKYGVFDMPLKEVNVNGKSMYDIGEGYMLVCLEENINDEDVNEIGNLGYLHVVFNDKSFSNDNVKLNAEHTLKNMGVEEVVSI